jgi:glycosyltransferase involved in cell wall biosynthesis
MGYASDQMRVAKKPCSDDGSANRQSDGARLAVAHLGPHPEGRGGMPAVLRALAASALSKRYDLRVIATYDRPEPVRRLIYFLRGTLALVRWSARPGRRIVHIHTTVRGSLYRKSLLVGVAKLMRRPVVLHVHAGAGDIEEFDGRIGPVRRALFARAFQSADRVLSVSRASADEIQRRLGRSDVRVVPNAAPPSRERTVDPAQTGVHILYLGGFANKVKGAAVLLDAIPAVLRGDSELEITLAGPGEPPVAARPLLAAGRVQWRGWLDHEEKEAALTRCDVFVLPSLSEGLPVALLEAMSWGCAIVATRVGGVPETLTDEEDALLVEPGDSGELERALVRLAGDSRLRARLGAAARARAERLNSDEVCGRLDAVYRELSAASAR